MVQIGGHLAWVSKLLRGRRRFGRKRPPPPKAIMIPDARPLGTFENKMAALTVTRAISRRSSHEKIGDCEQCTIRFENSIIPAGKAVAVKENAWEPLKLGLISGYQQKKVSYRFSFLLPKLLIFISF